MNSTFIIWTLLVLLCAQTLFIVKMVRKLKKYKAKIIGYTTVLNRFYDAHHLVTEFQFIMKPFYDYVVKGERTFGQVRDDIRFAYDDEKEKTIENYLGTTSLMKIQKQQTSIKRS